MALRWGHYWEPQMAQMTGRRWDCTMVLLTAAQTAPTTVWCWVFWMVQHWAATKDGHSELQKVRRLVHQKAQHSDRRKDGHWALRLAHRWACSWDGHSDSHLDNLTALRSEKERALRTDPQLADWTARRLADSWAERRSGTCACTTSSQCPGSRTAQNSLQQMRTPRSTMNHPETAARN